MAQADGNREPVGGRRLLHALGALALMVAAAA